MRKLSASLLVIYGASCFPAVAADLAVSPSVQPAPYQEVYVEGGPQWDGPYAGLSGGYGWTGSRGTFSGGGETGFGYNGALASLFGGYNMQLDNNIVVGVEGDVDYSWGSDDPTTGPGIYAEDGFDWSGTLRGRLGYAFDDALIYVTGGAAVTNVGLRGKNVDLGGTVYGYALGGGLDYALTDNVFTRLEYRYTGYPDQKVDSDLPAGETTKFTTHTHAVMAGIGVKF